MILTKELQWEPDARALAWAKTLIAGLKDGGTWLSRNGIHVVDHKVKTFTLVLKTPCWDSVIHDKTRRTFEKFGYQLIETQEVKSV